MSFNQKKLHRAINLNTGEYVLMPVPESVTKGLNQMNPKSEVSTFQDADIIIEKKGHCDYNVTIKAKKK